MAPGCLAARHRSLEQGSLSVVAGTRLDGTVYWDALSVNRGQRERLEMVAAGACVDPSRVGTYAFVNPIVTLFVGWMFAGETLYAPTISAVLVIVVGVALIIGATQNEKGKSHDLARVALLDERA